jgi:predicted Fe-Mo cluster-binding NifX family protein
MNATIRMINIYSREGEKYMSDERNAFEVKKICITAAGNSLDSMVDPRFGRCSFFIIIDPGTGKFEAIANPNVAAMGGAGVQSAQLVVEKGVTTVLTGNVGPNAFQALNAAQIEIIIGISGKVSDVLEKYKQGELKRAQSPSVASKHGIKAKNI